MNVDLPIVKNGQGQVSKSPYQVCKDILYIAKNACRRNAVYRFCPGGWVGINSCHLYKAGMSKTGWSVSSTNLPLPQRLNYIFYGGFWCYFIASLNHWYQSNLRKWCRLFDAIIYHPHTQLRSCPTEPEVVPGLLQLNSFPLYLPWAQHFQPVWSSPYHKSKKKERKKENKRTNKINLNT